jgi:hypothetical protein
MGQASNVLKAITYNQTHSLLPQLRVEIPRHHMVNYLRVLSGCDFVTPHNHGNKPKCKFCDKPKADWLHLLFKCNKRTSLIVDRFTQTLLQRRDSSTSDFVSKKFGECVDILTGLQNDSDFETLFHLLLGVTLENYNLNFMFILETTIPLISETIFDISKDWNNVERAG